MAGELFEENLSYFQLQKGLKLPIFIRFHEDIFDSNLANLLNACGYEKLSNEEQTEAMTVLQTDTKSRVLDITECSPSIARQIEMSTESDRFGMESIVPKENYRVYRYRRVAMIVYATSVREWQMGCFDHFGNSENEFSHGTVITRYSSWALASLGIVGFWGIPIDEGIVVMKHSEAQAEAVFVDIQNMRLLTREGVITIRPLFRILRLDDQVKDRDRMMRPEELLSFLTHHCTYFEYTGPSAPLRQVIQYISRVGKGIIHPRESFKSRSDLSL
jgi:hypothetical protein